MSRSLSQKNSEIIVARSFFSDQNSLLSGLWQILGVRGSPIIKFLIKRCRQSCEARKAFYICSTIIGRFLNRFSVTFVISPLLGKEKVIDFVTNIIIIQNLWNCTNNNSITHPCHWGLAEKAYLLSWERCGIGPENIHNY